jgi:hypothetical protein
MQFDVLTVSNRKTMVFWDATPHSQINRFQHFRLTCYLNLQEGFSTMRMEAAASSETVVTLHHPTRCQIPEEAVIFIPCNLTTCYLLNNWSCHSNSFSSKDWPQPETPLHSP